ncbi:MAG: putative metal-binding motif-containing protein [Myxococcota bacterium]
MNRAIYGIGFALLVLAGCSTGTGIASQDASIESDAGVPSFDPLVDATDPLNPFDATSTSKGDAESVTSGDSPEDVTLEDVDAPCPGCLGSPCDDNDDCLSGWCVEGPDGTMCTKTCDDSCPEGFECKSVASGAGDPVFICIYAHLAYCRPCDGDADCAHPTATGVNSHCVSHGEAMGSYCATACLNGTGCPAGSDCLDTDVDGVITPLCMPADEAECACSSWAIEVAAETQCAVANDLGACPGARRCEANGLSACEGDAPAAEECNALDDDCDGATDEDFPELGQPCDGDDADLCQGGTWSCADDGTTICTDSDSVAGELCNALDDDCDGATDEDFAELGQPCDGADVDLCEDGLWTCDGAGVSCQEAGDLVELCNALDDDCDGATDEDFPDLGEACDGADDDDCQFGVWACDNDSISCAEPETPEETLTDLDGTSDLTLGEACGAGACGGGVVTCGDDLVTLACSTVGEVTEESCNGLDDDCDGVTDEDFAAGGTISFTDLDGTEGLTLGETCGAGLCGDGEVLCSEDGSGLVCSTTSNVSPDLCNGLDDDCDGMTDEDYAAGGTVTFTDPSSATPLTLGAPCGVGTCAGGVVSCTPEGTQLTCSSAGMASDDICDGLDNDCDGATDEAYTVGGSFSLVDLDGTEGLTKGDACGVGACGGGLVVCGADMGSIVCSTHSAVDVDICDNVDNDCDGVTDEAYIDGGSVTYDDPSGSTGLIKGDACGAGLCDGGTVICSADSVTLVCSNSPEGGELCDDIDNDCDGETDEGCDDDGDGFCDVNNELVGTPAICPLGGGDCDDDAELIHPNMIETCDDVDNNCTGGVDEGCDDDGDGYCDQNMSVEGAPAVCPNGDGDCNDDLPDIHSGATEICDDIDNNCDGTQDEGCNDDGDGYCDGTMITVGLPGACAMGGGDCDDTRNDIYPSAPELCDDADNNCVDGVDEACDGDGDGWCDASAVVIGAPAVCSAGTGDCNDSNDAIHPTAEELCDDIDNDCVDGIDFGCDDDGDGYCDASMSVVSLPSTCPLGGGDCADNDEEVYPGAVEACDDLDNNCVGGIDEGCDDDGDDYCDISMVIVGAPAVCVMGGGDCADELPAIHPGAVEVCDDVDNNCTDDIDEGCDDDGDDYCDVTMTHVGASAACPLGPGDCQDDDDTIHPGAEERCDDLDNNCAGGVDEGCDDDGDDFCDSAMEVVGQPAICPLGAGDCSDTNDAVNPNASEFCDDLDNNCAGGVDEGCDDDGDDYCDAAMEVVGEPTTCPLGQDDCDDTNEAIHPGATELCDDIDNNCAQGIDEGCDDDGDDYCDATMTLVGLPAVCPLGGNDCVDSDDAINEAAAELCDDVDNDCDGEVDGPFVDGTVTYDDDPSQGSLNKGDSCGSGACSGGLVICTPDGVALICSTDGDAGDGEICDGVDNDCNGEIDEGCDDDGDDYCDITMTVIGAPSVCPNGIGDCDDTQIGINPGATEICDDVDNDCAFGVDQGCDDDGDGYCDADMIILGSPAICTQGGNDCVDTSESIHPGATELCDGVDNDCGQGVDEGCDDDGDDYCDANMITVGLPPVCPLGGGDCADALGQAAIHPGATELCDNLDNDCGQGVDEGCDDDGDNYCDASMTVVGSPSACPLGEGDCNDANDEVHPNATERCDNVDNDCVGGVDEGCDDDNDGYCDENMDVEGTPLTCLSGGGDCQDTDPNINPGQAELCNGINDNCTGGVDEGLSAPLNDNQLGACEGTVQSCGGLSGWQEDYSSVATYGAPETPSSAFADENCDGVDGDASNAVFVATGGATSGDCGKKGPCASISYAMTRAIALGKEHVYIRAGTYSGPITLKNNIWLFGGYDSGWVRDAHTVPGHEVTINGGYDSTVGQYLVLRGVNIDTIVADLTLNAPNANGRISSGQGRSSYGAHIRGGDVTFRRMTIEQGNGYSGQSGSSGNSASKAAAPSGSNGGNADQYNTPCNNSSHGGGGSGGSRSCSGTTTSGGSGGNGGEMDTSCGWTGLCSNCSATSGDNGSSGSGGNGGDSGSGGGTCAQGEDAEDGGKSNGSGGSGAATKGRLISYYWYAKDGASGGIGSHGGGGGGGGGSGGCDDGTDSYGAGGGGGGAGGCRASSAGSAGKGGGGSFGVFGYSSDLTVTSVTFIRGNGASGGSGGSGGSGQPGGDGGNGGQQDGDSKRGGHGGDGGDGGHSGGGGGGGGGHSYGIYHYNSDVSQSGNSFSSGSAGSGGSGGTSSGANGGGGNPGILGSLAACNTTGGC